MGLLPGRRMVIEQHGDANYSVPEPTLVELKLPLRELGSELKDETERF